MWYAVALAVVTGLGLPLAVLAAAHAQGRAAAAAMEGMSRQPEVAGRIFNALLLSLALMEALVIYALIMFFFLFSKLPAAELISAAVTGGP